MDFMIYNVYMHSLNLPTTKEGDSKNYKYKIYLVTVALKIETALK